MPLPFLKDHAVKLWKLLAGGVILEIIFHGTFTSIWNPLIFTFLPNLIPHANVIQGPWWFFSLIMQFYLIYAFIIYNKSNSRLVLLTIASMLLLIVAAHISDDYLHYLKFNSFGWVLPFAAGVFCSRQKIKLPRAVLLLSLPILILCEFYFYMWLFAPIFVILIFFPLAKIRNKAYRNFWKFIGAVSPAIFVFHPFIRTGCRYINNANFTGSIYIGIMCYLIICVVFAYFYSKILSFVNNRL